jgi:hypothetical protein
MDKYPVANPDAHSLPLPRPVALTAAETKQVAGGRTLLRRYKLDAPDGPPLPKHPSEG